MNSGSLQRLLIWAILLGGWETAYRAVGWRPYIFPAPSHVLDATLGLLNLNTDFGSPLHPGWPRMEGQPLVGAIPLDGTPASWPHWARVGWGYVLSTALLPGSGVSAARLAI